MLKNPILKQGILYYQCLLDAAFRRRKIRNYLKSTSIKGLNIGCGNNILRGWLNADIHASEGIISLDISKKLPFPDDSLQFIFAEHVIEHISQEECDGFLLEARRILQPGGRIRLATPDLDFFVEMLSMPMSDKATVYQAWYAKRKAIDFAIPAYAINSIFYEHGHRFIYNEALLTIKLIQTGFINVKRYEVGESDRSMLQEVEGHGDVLGIGHNINSIETVVVEAEAE